MYPLNLSSHGTLLNCFFENQKERTPVLITPFGYVVYSEENSANERLFFIIQLSAWAFGEDFRAESVILASSQKEMDDLLKNPNYFYHYHHSFLGGNTVEFVQEKCGKLASDEVYFVENNYSSYAVPEEHIYKLKVEKYIQILTNYFLAHPVKADDLYPLDYSLKDESKIVKLYNDRLSSFTNCKNLRVISGYGYGAPRSSQFDNTWFTADVAKLGDLVCLSVKNNHSLQAESLNAIQHLSQLVELNLTDNHINEIPTGIDQLKQLKRLILDDNDFTTMDAFLTLNQLEELSLNRNFISEIPENCNQLTQLRKLDLSGNQLTHLPEQLKLMEQLKIVNLSNNPLQTIPDWIGEMTQLEELHLTQTQLTSLPESIVSLKNTKLFIKKNPFERLPKEMLSLDKSMVELEERNRALFDPKTAKKLAKLPTGNVKFEKDFNFKLMVIQRLMYDDELLLPKFDVYTFAESYKKRKINLDKIDYTIIPEVKAYFEALEIPLPLLWDIKELRASGGDEIYHQCMPHWDGEDDVFDVLSAEDVVHFPNLKKMTILGKNKEVVQFLRERKIKVSFE